MPSRYFHQMPGGQGRGGPAPVLEHLDCAITDCEAGRQQAFDKYFEAVVLWEDLARPLDSREYWRRSAYQTRRHAVTRLRQSRGDCEAWKQQAFNKFNEAYFSWEKLGLALQSREMWMGRAWHFRRSAVVPFLGRRPVHETTI
eukprot:s596_g19.t1